IDASKLEAWCKNFGGTGEITSIDDWLACLKKASACEARQATVSRFPQSLAMLKKLKAAMASAQAPASDPSKGSDAQTALDDTLDSIDSDDNDVLDPGCAGFEGVLCPAGQERDFGSNDCTDCPAGSYNPTVGARCVPCPPGSVAGSTGSVECTPCADG